MPGPDSLYTERELIVITTPEAKLNARNARTLDTSEGGRDLVSLLRSEGASAVPLFDVAVTPEGRRGARADEEPAAGEGRRTFLRIQADEEKLDTLAEKLLQVPSVEGAYVKPPAEPARLNTMPPSGPPSAKTPDFSDRQLYLDPAPGGINARHAWKQPGGRGEGVRIIDIEGAWRFSHEDLLKNQGGLAGGTPANDVGWRNHGTAVIGVFSANSGGVGVTGICPEATVQAISIFPQTMGSAKAIRQAATMLRPGDILLLELHRPGPSAGFQLNPQQKGFIAVEWWPDDYEAIQFAVKRGILVVEAAGNGGENLDDDIYEHVPRGFPASWRNPFRRKNGRDSGAIVVGAGAPPPGTHGKDHGPDRSRLSFSNHGGLIDAQGWGLEVTTCGYGDLQGGNGNEDFWYTNEFSGTSSASPIVVGALGCTQGILRARGEPLLTPQKARQLLRKTGSPQQGAPQAPLTQRIGSRPDIRALLKELVGDTEAKAAAKAPKAATKAPKAATKAPKPPARKRAAPKKQAPAKAAKGSRSSAKPKKTP